ncbi:MAG TPA: arginase family protein [Burkholderiales bacterium]
MITFLSCGGSSVDNLKTRFAVLGIPQGIPYPGRSSAGAAEAPAAIRNRSARYGRMLSHYDFDLGRAPGPLPIADCGDVAVAEASAAVRGILKAGAMPIVLGGDDSTTALALRGFEGQELFHILQIDAHIDYRDEVDGLREGYSSPMRRAAEMPWVKRIVHCGTRGVGSARPDDVRDTLARGNAIVTARELRERGVERVLAEFPPGQRYYIAFDCDGMDPAVMPGTSAPLPGGITFDDAADLLTGLARRGQVVGINVAEHYPSLDVNGITALAITRLLVNLMGTMHA